MGKCLGPLITSLFFAATLQDVAAQGDTFVTGCALTTVNITPLMDMGDELYKGHSGGLEQDGSNTRATAHNDSGLAIAMNSVKPRDASGAIDFANGKIVLMSIGFSNVAQEFDIDGPRSFRLRDNDDPLKSTSVFVLNSVQGGQAADVWSDPDATVWTNIDEILFGLGLTAEQIQVLWVKLSDRHSPANGAFPLHSELLQSRIEETLRIAKFRYSNAYIAYLSSRTRSYSNDPSELSPKPFAFETGFAAKWAIEKQINGDSTLNFDQSQGTVNAPWIAWGPYLWADGVNPRSDGFTWLCEDLDGDFAHPSDSGSEKVATLLLDFFKSGETATPWFLAPPGEGEGESFAERAQSLFDMFDTSDENMDGTLNLAEARSVLSTLTIDDFDVLNTNDDRELSRNELIFAGAQEPPTTSDGCCFDAKSTNRLKNFFGDLFLLELLSIVFVAWRGVGPHP